jgi:hypothetical protein
MNPHSPEKAKLIKKHIDRLQKIRRPVCLARGVCNGTIGKSHTISKSKSLSLIGEKDHVLVRQGDLFRKTRTANNLLVMKKTSVNEALTFKGFCNQHDNDLFQCLDNEQFMATAEQIFMQAYRCASREYYFKDCQVKAFLDEAQIAEMQGLPKNNKYELSPEFESIKTSMQQGLADIRACKEKFDDLIVNKDYRRLQSYVIHSSSSPVLACAGSFFPDYLSNGNLLQDFTDFGSNPQFLFVSVIPDQFGMFIVLSFFDNEAKAPTRFIEDLIETNKLTQRIIWMCMTRIENLAVKPSWWTELPNETHDNINEAVHYNANKFDIRFPTFNRMPDLKIPEWEIQHQFWI